MVEIGLGIIVSALSLTYLFNKAYRERHFVPRDGAVNNGLVLIGNGISLIIFNPALYLYGLPLAIYPLVQGFAGVGLTVKREELGNKILLSSLAALLMTTLILVVQFGILK